jgi:hypothetical protein
MDPPDQGTHDWACRARVVNVCPNNSKLHYYNIQKYPQFADCLYAVMPSLSEVVAMGRVLWDPSTSNLPGTYCQDDKEMENILAMRCFLVGTAPRYVFSYAKFRERLMDIAHRAHCATEQMFPYHHPKIISETQIMHEDTGQPSGVSSYLYHLNDPLSLKETSDMTKEPAVTMNPYAKACFFKSSSLFGEATVTDKTEIALFDNDNLFQVPCELSFADHLRFVDAVLKATTNANVYNKLTSRA